MAVGLMAFSIGLLTLRPGFSRDGQELNVSVQGQAIFNNTFLMLQGAIDGLGMFWVPHDLVTSQLSSGALVAILEDWWPGFPG